MSNLSPVTSRLEQIKSLLHQQILRQDRTNRLLCKIVENQNPIPDDEPTMLSVSVRQVPPDKEPQMFPAEIARGNNAIIKVTPTKNGQALPIDGPVSFTVDTPGVSVEQIDDFTGRIVTKDQTASVVTVNLSADARIGPAVKNITETVELTILDPEADTLGINVTEETPATPPPPPTRRRP